MLDRRSFIGLVGGALVADRLNPLLRAANATHGLGGSSALTAQHVGIQLYTVRGEMQKSLPDTLKRLALIGYREVEFAGYFDRTPAELKSLLELNHLTAPSTHVQLGKAPDDWKRAVADAKALGCTYCTVPFLDAKERQSLDDYRRVAQRFNEAAAIAKQSGLRFAYHNHDFELRPMQGRVPLEVLLAETDPSLVSFEMDIYWVVKGGGDPMALLNAHPGRFRLVHAKDATAAPALEMTDVGRGTIDFARILASPGARSIEHVFVEHDNPSHVWDSVTASYQSLSRIIG
jgi:sugar phosphate isomerase/epimerase